MFWLFMLMFVMLKKINLIKSKNCDKIMFLKQQNFFFFPAPSKNNLNSLFIWLSLCLMQAIEAAASRDGETLKHSFAHTSPKMVTIILCFKSKSRRKKRTVERPARNGKKKGKNNWNKVNQNQITSEFHDLNHSNFVAFCVFDLEFLMLWGLSWTDINRVEWDG